MWNYQQVCSSIVIMRVPLGEALPILIWLPLKPDPIQERTPLCTLYTNTKTIELSNALRWEICLCSFTHGDLHCSTASDFSFEPVKVRLCYILKDILKTASKEVLIPKIENWFPFSAQKTDFCQGSVFSAILEHVNNPLQTISTDVNPNIPRFDKVTLWISRASSDIPRIFCPEPMIALGGNFKWRCL